jgi:1,4-alpha-glucan branching enzyme
MLRDLNTFYREHAALYESDFSWQGFTWLDFRDSRNSVLAFARHPANHSQIITVVCNFTPVVRHNYRIPVLQSGTYHEAFNSDDLQYGGSGVVNDLSLSTTPTPWQEHPYALSLTLPPLAVVYLKLEKEIEQEKAGTASPLE